MARIINSPTSTALRSASPPQAHPGLLEEPKFRFVHSDGVKANATTCSGSLRSHAIRAGLQLRLKEMADQQRQQQDEGGSARKKEAKLKDGLGRFRLDSAPPNPRKGKPVKKRRMAAATSDAGADADADASSLCEDVGGASSGTTSPGEEEMEHPGAGATSKAVVSARRRRWRRSPSRETSVEWLGSEELDPFGTFPIQSNWRVDLIVKHMMIIFDIHTTTVPPPKTWFGGFCMSDPLLMKVTLSMAVGWWTAANPALNVAIRQEGWRMRGEAISDVNARIQSGQMNELLLVGVAQLCEASAFDGFYGEAQIHLRALHRMIDLGGGPIAVRRYQVGRFVNWADMHVAAALGKKPFLPLFHTLSDVILPRAVCDEPDLSGVLPPSYPLVLALDPLHYLNRLSSLGPKAMTVQYIFRLVRQRVRADAYGMDGTQPESRTLLNTAAHTIATHVVDEPTTPEEHCLQALLMAANVFVYAELWVSGPFPVGSPLIKILLGRLQAELAAGKEDAEVRALWREHVVLLVWVLFVGAVTTERDEDGRGQWFLGRLRVACQFLGCTSREEVEGYLAAVAWNGRFGNGLLGRWWGGKALLEGEGRIDDQALRQGEQEGTDASVELVLDWIS